MAKKIKAASVKIFLSLFLVSLIFYGVLRLLSITFNVDTNVDTGNPILSISYYIAFTLIALSGLGLIIALFVALLKKKF